MTHEEQPLRVEDVMTREVITSTPATPFKTLARSLSENRISALPVVDSEGRVVGVVSEADLLLKEGRADLEPARLFESRSRRLERAKAHGITAAEVMTTPALTVAPKTPVAEAARLMRERRVKRLPVVDGGGHLAGIVSRGDLVRVFLRADADIKRAVARDLAQRVLWLDTRELDVEVVEGMVTLNGRLDRRSDGEILSGMASEVDGVVAVVNNLSYDWDDHEAAALPNAAAAGGPWYDDSRRL